MDTKDKKVSGRSKSSEMEGSVIGAVNVTNDYWRSVWAIGQKEKYEGIN